MCGRYALSLRAGDVRSQVESQTGRHVGAWEDESDYNPDRGYNIPPRSRNPVILRGGGGVGDVYDQPSEQDRQEKKDDARPSKSSKTDLSELRLECMQWGLVPHWMKRQPDHASTLKTINARDDTIVEGGSMWKSIRGRRRCVVVAEGFYEWLKKGNDRVPHHVKRKDGKLFCFAGLWDTVTYEGETKPLRTYTIVTTHSNKQLNFLHDRMPVVLDGPKDIETWLDTSSGNWSKEAADLLKPFEGELECYIVPKEVGKVGNQSADFLKPISERKGNISSFFAKSANSNTSDKKPEQTSKPKSSPQADSKPSSRDSKGKSKKEEEDDSVEVVKETDLALNPDEVDKVKAESSIKKTSKESGDSTEKPIVLDDSKSSAASTKNPKGKKSEPIVLDDDSTEEEKPKSRSGSKRKRQNASAGGGRSQKAAKKADEDTDGEGNEKVTSFFEVIDDA